MSVNDSVNNSQGNSLGAKAAAQAGSGASKNAEANDPSVVNGSMFPAGPLSSVKKSQMSNRPK